MARPALKKVENFFRHHDHRIAPVSESGCWIWMGDLQSQGYGVAKLRGVRHLAHRLAYQASGGEIPEDHYVRHTCDVPCCVNPAHLLTGTQSENMADMKARGRQSRGERRPLAKLTESDVRRIRDAVLAGATQAQIAEQFGVTKGRISLIKNRKRWSHVE